MTDNELIQMLEIKIDTEKRAEKIFGIPTPALSDFNTCLLDLINRQKAEIERLSQNLEEAHIDIREHLAEIVKLRTNPIIGTLCPMWKNEAIREFAKKLKRKSKSQTFNGVRYVCVYDINNLVKELTEGGNE